MPSCPPPYRTDCNASIASDDSTTPRAHCGRGPPTADGTLATPVVAVAVTSDGDGDGGYDGGGGGFAIVDGTGDGQEPEAEMWIWQEGTWMAGGPSGAGSLKNLDPVRTGVLRVPNRTATSRDFFSKEVADLKLV